MDKKVQKTGDWFRGNLEDLYSHGDGGEGGSKCNLILAILKRVCNSGSEEEHVKVRGLAKEILNDWDAVVAFVKNPELPPTNNDAKER